MPTPLYDRITAFAKEQKAPFYMPGHKGRGLDRLSDLLFPLDVTELPGTDSLFCPEEVIAQAEALCAQAFGAAHTHFLVNGSSGGILAMLAYALPGGGQVLVDRNCHHSVLSGLVMTGAQPLYLSPAFLDAPGIPGGLSPAQVEAALSAHPGIRAVLVTSPNYYGLCHDLSAIAAAAHRHGCLLLVDEAHGAHFAFGEGMPPTALSCGADLAVQSMHKTLPAPNQSALLHAGPSVDDARLKQCINCFQTTSPSYPILAYMDLARELCEAQGMRLSAALARRLEPVRPWCAAPVGRQAYVAARDPWKLLLNDQTRTGPELAEELRRCGIWLELCDRHNCLLLASWHTTDENMDALCRALTLLDVQPRTTFDGTGHELPALSQPDMTPREAFFAPSETLPLTDAVGRVSRYNVTAFPPCVPTILCGERITDAQVTAVARLSAMGTPIQGLTDGCVAVVGCSQ